ncbi:MULTISPECIES: S8 family serine peptidase [unclassified Novosphingobium]|uniref:subtilisin-like serine protease QhpE n=1 Tax=unclassified Novosphingobium TaxID=2644732 RepID=UPI0025FB0BFC|nr:MULTISPECIES: S8 family serine peptidase [unclassified Novosphingobium]HQS70190.1 S8 family serine peptidase [Novosphingobium sp.]
MPRRIAVIDSGVHPTHPHICAAQLLPGLSVLADGTVLDDPAESLDKLGHGTAVTAAIQELAPEAAILPIRVFREGLRASARALATGIRQALEARCDLINLSLGTTNPAHADVFAALAQEAAEQGALIVAAFETEGVPCWPGCLPHVLGVGLDWDLPRGALTACPDQRMVMASGYPRPIPGVEQRRNLYGVSFAVAQATGWIAARNGLQTREDVLTALEFCAGS